MNAQREVIYRTRRQILEGGDLKDQALDMVREVVAATVDTWCSPDVFPEEWDRSGLLTALTEIYPVKTTLADIRDVVDPEPLRLRFEEEATGTYEAKEAAVTPEVMRELERVVLLNVTDTKWREHLYEMDYLQEGIHLRSYAQKDPLTEYQREAFEMFEDLSTSIRSEFATYIFRVEFVRQDVAPAAKRLQENSDEVKSQGKEAAGGSTQAVSDKTPRNAPCPCGSGKKYKKCHGAVV